MMMKKSFAFIALFFMFISLFAVFVSAQTASEVGQSVTNFINSVASAGSPVFSTLLGTSDNGSELFVRVLAFFLVTLVIYGVMDSVKIVHNKWINFSIGIIISLIGIRFMPEGLLVSLTEPASALVALVFMGLPFVVAFFMIEKINSAPARKALWTAYGVLMFVLFLYKWGSKGFNASFAWVDLLIVFAIIILFTFDGSFQRWKSKSKVNRLVGNMDADEIDRISTLLENKKNALTRSATTSERKAELRAEIKELEKELRSFAGSAASKGVTAI